MGAGNRPQGTKTKAAKRRGVRARGEKEGSTRKKGAAGERIRGREAEGKGESGGRPQELFRAGESDEKNGLAMNAAGKKARERRNAPAP